MPLTGIVLAVTFVASLGVASWGVQVGQMQLLLVDHIVFFLALFAEGLLQILVIAAVNRCSDK